MKVLPALLCVCAALLTPPLFAESESTQQLAAEGQAAYVKGDLKTARKNFELINQLEPRNQTAINYLRLIATREAREPRGGGGLQQQLAAVILPKVELKEATLGSALEYLRQQVPKVSNGKASVNFVVLLPEEQVNTQPVTLQLRDVPFTEAMRYLSDLAGLKVEYEKYAVKITPLAGAAPATARSAPAAAPAPAAVPGLSQ